VRYTPSSHACFRYKSELADLSEQAVSLGREAKSGEEGWRNRLSAMQVLLARPFPSKRV
jgi:hypothetical protein